MHLLKQYIKNKISFVCIYIYTHVYMSPCRSCMFTFCNETGGLFQREVQFRDRLIWHRWKTHQPHATRATGPQSWFRPQGGTCCHSKAQVGRGQPSPELPIASQSMPALFTASWQADRQVQNHLEPPRVSQSLPRPARPGRGRSGLGRAVPAGVGRRQSGSAAASYR